jgi:hypothetical protein
MADTILKRCPLSDNEIQERIKVRSSTELRSFREKLRKINTPEALAVRFFIVKEMLAREFDYKVEEPVPTYE